MRITSASLKKALARTYHVHAREFKPFHGGVANTNVRVKSEVGDLVVRMYRTRKPREIAFETLILTFAASHGLPCPNPMQNRFGQTISRICGKPAIVYPCLPGKTIRTFSSMLLQEVGHLQGKLHALTIGKANPVKKARWDLAEIRQGAKRWKINAHDRLTSDRAAIADWIHDELTKLTIPTDLPRGWTHQDFKPANVLVENGHVSGILDFDNGYEGILAIDLMTTLLWFGSKGSKWHPSAIRSILNGYEQHRPLTATERAHLPDLLRWRTVREALIWSWIEAGVLNPDTTKAQRKAAGQLVDRFKILVAHMPRTNAYGK